MSVLAPPFGEISLCDSTVGDTVAYASYGREEAPAVFVLGGITAHRFVCGENNGSESWWPGVVGSGCALNPEDYRIVSLDWLDGAGDSTKPSYDDGISFPVVTTQDQASAVVAVLDHLGIEKLYGFVGASYGGMVGLALGSLYPERIQQLLVLCAAHRSHPMATALRIIQRRIATLGASASREKEGLVLARALAMTTYRTPEEFEHRFKFLPDWKEESPSFDVEKYLNHCGENFSYNFNALTFGILSQSLDIHLVEPEGVTVPVTVFSVDSDAIVPPWLVDEFVQRLPNLVEEIRITSHFGHDSFLKEHRVVSRLVEGFLNSESYNG